MQQYDYVWRAKGLDTNWINGTLQNLEYNIFLINGSAVCWCTASYSDYNFGLVSNFSCQIKQYE